MNLDIGYGARTNRPCPRVEIPRRPIHRLATISHTIALPSSSIATVVPQMAHPLITRPPSGPSDRNQSVPPEGNHFALGAPIESICPCPCPSHQRSVAEREEWRYIPLVGRAALRIAAFQRNGDDEAYTPSNRRVPNLMAPLLTCHMVLGPGFPGCHHRRCPPSRKVLIR